MGRSEVPACSECDAFEENPWAFAAYKICPECPWGRTIRNPLLDELMHYLLFIDSGCPFGRAELTDAKWTLLGSLKMEREQILAERGKQNYGDTQ